MQKQERPAGTTEEKKQDLTQQPSQKPSDAPQEEDEDIEIFDLVEKYKGVSQNYKQKGGQ